MRKGEGNRVVWQGGEGGGMSRVVVFLQGRTYAVEKKRGGGKGGNVLARGRKGKRGEKGFFVYFWRRGKEDSTG